MAKRVVKEKEVIEYLTSEGFRGIKTPDKSAAWYKKAAKKPSCFKVEHKGKERKSG